MRETEPSNLAEHRSALSTVSVHTVLRSTSAAAGFSRDTPYGDSDEEHGAAWQATLSAYRRF